MTRITADASLLAKLDNLSGVVQLCDETGRTLGYFHPAVLSDGSPTQRTASPISDEAIEECRQQRSGRPLSEIMTELERQS
jgi:hypothetical protein